MSKTGINQRQVKTTNQSLIIKEIRENGHISRALLAKKLKLSAPSISNNIDDLISRNIIFETGAGKSDYGRKPINLQFNNSYGYIIAVDMITAIIRIAISDLSGTNIINEDIVDDALIINDSVIEKVIDCIRQMCVKSRINSDQILCICIASPGIINPETDEITFCPRIKRIDNESITAIFNKYFDTKIMIRNDVNCATYGEYLYSAKKINNDFIHIYIDIGTGSGICLNGKIYTGKNGGAGEFGLWAMNIADAVNQNKVLLSNVLDYRISLFGLVSRLKESYPDIFSNLKEGEIDMHVIPDYLNALFDSVNKGDPRVISFVLNSAVELACVIKNICEFLDLNVVIIGGKVLGFGEIYMRTLTNFLKANSTQDIKVVTSELKENSVLYGAFGECINFVISDLLS